MQCFHQALWCLVTCEGGLLDCSARTGAASLTVTTGQLTAQLPVGLCKEISTCFSHCILVRLKYKFYRELGSLKFPVSSLDMENFMTKEEDQKKGGGKENI